MFQVLQHLLDKSSVEVNDNHSSDEADTEDRNKQTWKALKKAKHIDYNYAGGSDGDNDDNDDDDDNDNDDDKAYNDDANDDDYNNKTPMLMVAMVMMTTTTMIMTIMITTLMLMVAKMMMTKTTIMIVQCRCEMKRTCYEDWHFLRCAADLCLR